MFRGYTNQPTHIKRIERMQTRSQTKMENRTPTYKIDIDFDDASNEWRKNKQHLGNGQYRYICEAKTQAGKECRNKICDKSQENIRLGFSCFMHCKATK